MLRYPRLSSGIDVFLVLAVALAIVNRYAPESYSGDVVLYSVMSLQNVTLFFWDQNRLLNVGPLLTSWIHEPSLNYFTNLLLPAFLFFALLRYGVFLAMRSVGPPAGNDLRLGENGIFLLLSLATCMLLQPHAVFDYVIWHIEYPLAWLLMLFAFFYVLPAAGKNARWPNLLTRYSTLLLLLVLAMGVNYSVALLAAALAMGRVWIQRRVDQQVLIFSACMFTTLPFWALVARRYPGPGRDMYAGMDLPGLAESIPKTLHSLGSAYAMPWLFALVAIILLMHFVLPHYEREKIPTTIRSFLLLFSLGWFFLFSGNAWVAANAYHFRYFAPLLLNGLMCFAVGLARLSFPSQMKGVQFFVPVMALLVLTTILVRPWVYVDQYAVTRMANKQAVDGVYVYAGDFNAAWTGVWGGLQRGEPAYGITYRANGNKNALLRFLENELATRGRLRVNCLSDTIAHCVEQANDYTGPLHLRESLKITDSGLHEHHVLLLVRADDES